MILAGYMKANSAAISRNSQGILGTKKCKIPVARSSKPAFLQWNLHLNIINLHFPRPKCPKALLERMHNRMYNLEKTKKLHFPPPPFP